MIYIKAKPNTLSTWFFSKKNYIQQIRKIQQISDAGF